MNTRSYRVAVATKKTYLIMFQMGFNECNIFRLFRPTQNGFDPQEPLHPKLPVDADEAALKAAVDWVFFVDALNFSFWSEETRERRYTVRHNGVDYVGYWSLCAAVYTNQPTPAP